MVGVNVEPVPLLNTPFIHPADSRGFPPEPWLTRFHDCGYGFGQEGESSAAMVMMVMTVMTAKMMVFMAVVFLYLAVRALFASRVGAGVDGGTERYRRWVLNILRYAENK